MAAYYLEYVSCIPTYSKQFLTWMAQLKSSTIQMWYLQDLLPYIIKLKTRKPALYLYKWFISIYAVLISCTTLP